MTEGTVYLDVDDEITSAAARIRASSSTKVALVVPSGSRISTSRMNFRLLSREAVVNNRRLSIVAADPAIRALAASAGLPVFATVGEYDAAVAGPRADDGEGGEADTGAGAATATAAAAAAAARPVRRPPTEDDDDEAADEDFEPTSRHEAPEAAEADDAREPQRSEVSDETMVLPTPSAAERRAAARDRAAAAAAADQAALERAGESPRRGPEARPEGVPAARPTVRHGRSGPRFRTPAIAVVGIALLALVVAGVAGYLFLPAATITVTPRQEAIAPISLIVRADPDATAVDIEAGIVPASRIDVPVEATRTFTTTGRRVEETGASGEVEFSSYNTAQTNTIPAGSIVSTEGGVQFRTTAAVSLPPAGIVPPLQIQPSTATVGVAAVRAGTAGNVPANAITVVPGSENPDLTKVRNPQATTGGTREEFPQVSQAEVDAALAELATELETTFAATLDAGAGAPPGTTVFPETAVLGEATPIGDPAALVGQPIESYDLGLAAAGSVIAVDESPIASIAETRLRATVGEEYRLVEESIRIEPGPGTVVAGQVSFPVTARASRIPLLDPAELLDLARGRSIEDARRALSAFGAVEIEAWPDWVTTITTFDSRVTLEIVGQDGSGDGDGPADPTGTPARPTPSGAAPSGSAAAPEPS